MELSLESIPVPLVVRRAPGGVLFEEPDEDVLRVLHQVLAQVLAGEDPLPEGVDGLPLLVHHVIVLQEMFPDFEVPAFDRLLRPFD